MRTIKSARAEYRQKFMTAVDEEKKPTWSPAAPGFKAWARRAFKPEECVGKLQKVVAAA